MPDSQWAAIRQLYFAMIVSAQRHVFLQQPYFIPDASIAEALKSAALSGIDVKLMISARPSGDPVPAWAGNTFMLDVVRAGARVFLYEKGYLHAKTISIDSEICSVGSTNIDSAASASTTRSMRCFTANGSPVSWKRTSSAISHIAPSSTRQSTGVATSRCACGTRPRGFCPPCCECARRSDSRWPPGYDGS